MSEKIYAWLLRLYPSSFQKAFGQEALQLFRDRARDETGFLSRLRLWFDLLIDMATSIPDSYRTAPGSLAISGAKRASDGTPSFSVLEDEKLGLGSLLYGGIASLVGYGSIMVLISYGGKAFPSLNLHQPPGYSAGAESPFSFATRGTQRHSGGFSKPAPTVNLEYLPAHPAPGSMVTLTAKVLKVGDGPTPTGFVRFYDGNDVLNLAKLNNGAVTVRGKLPGNTEHSLSATYYGDATYSPASSSGEE